MGTQTIERTTTTTWEIDPSHTFAEFAVKHMMFATARGRFTGVSGTIVVDEADPTASSVTVSIDAGTVNTGDEKRDGHLKSADFFDVENAPAITFASTSVSGGGDRFKVEGDLTIRGVTKPVTLDVERLGGGTTPFGTEIVAFEATTKVNRKDFGLTWNAPIETGGVLVSDEVKISIDLEAVKQ